MFCQLLPLLYFYCLVTPFSFDGEVYRAVEEESKYSHNWTLGLANYRGQALTTGCNSFKDCSFKTELLDMQKNEPRGVFKFLLG